MATKKIDFNSDLAQGFGIYKNDLEYEMLDYVSSVNIACGFHAGDPLSIRNALLACKEKNIAIGAHIGFQDISGFGNRPMELTEDEIEAIVLYQLGAITSFAKSYSLNVEHVRPHGAMYKMASENFEFSLSIAKAIQKFDKWLTYVGLANETLEKVAADTNIIIAREVFALKNYNADGTVNWEMGSVTPEIAQNRVRTLSHSSQMKVQGGNFIPVNCDTIHFACDSKDTIELAKKLNEIIAPTPFNYNKVEISGWV